MIKRATSVKRRIFAALPYPARRLRERLQSIHANQTPILKQVTTLRVPAALRHNLDNASVMLTINSQYKRIHFHLAIYEGFC